MANGQQQGIDDPFTEASRQPSPQPLPATQTAFEVANTGGDVPMVNEFIKKDYEQRQAKANLYLKNAADLHGLLHHLEDLQARASMVNPDTKQPYTDDDIRQLEMQRDHTYDQYEKLVGVDKESKGALQKARGIIDLIRGHRKAAMTPPPSPNYPTTVGDTGVSTASGGPITPNYPTNVSESGGVSYDPLQGGMQPPPPAPTLTPFQQAIRSSIQLPFATHPAKVNQAISDELEERRRKWQQDVDLRTQEATKMGLDPNSREFKQYVAIGSFPAVFGLQKIPYTDPKDPKHKVQWGNYNKATGEISDQSGNVVPNAEAANMASLTPHVIKYRPKNPDGSYQTGPDGQPIEAYGIQQGNQLFDQANHELPEGTEAFPPSAFITKTTTGSSQKIDPLTGKRISLSSTRTTGPAAAKITGPGGYKPQPEGGSPPLMQPGASKPAGVPNSSSPATGLSGSAGTRAQQDADREAAYLKRNNLRNVTSSTRTMIEAAPKVEDFVDKIQSQIDGLQNDLGPTKGRWNEFWAGKVGTKNPKYTALRTDVGLLSTLLMRMHVGARGGEYIMKHFEDLIDQGKQDPDNLRAALKEIKDYADNVIQEGRQQGIDMAPNRPGGPSAPPSKEGGWTPF